MTRHERQARSAPRIDLTQRLSHPAGLRLRVHVLGAIAFCAYACMTVLSFVQVPALWRHEPAPRTQAFFEMLGAKIEPWLPFASGWLRDKPLFLETWSIVLTYWATLALATGAVVVLVVSLLRSPERAEAGLADLLVRWSYAFAAVSALAFPVFTQDFWLSAAWGRMIAAGVNPFHTLFTPETLAGLPLDHFPMPMSYGPLWGVLSAGLMFVAGESTLLAAVLFKLLIGVAWIASIRFVYGLTAGLSADRRCLAVGIYGWVPAGVSQSLAEGHNDIVMVVLALLWLHLLLADRWQAPSALAASVLCKYVTAPLFLIDALYVLRYRKVAWPHYGLRLVLPAALTLATTALFYRSTEFFDGVRLVSTWYFLQPRDAIQAVELATGVPMLPLALTVTALFPAVAAYALWTAWTEPTSERLQQAALAVMSAVLFTAVSHLWAWYVIWALALAVLQPTWWLSRFIIGIAIMSPFTLGFWWIEPFADHREAVALGLYVIAILWTVATRPAGDAPLLKVAKRA